jgi:hypothetical protein
VTLPSIILLKGETHLLHSFRSISSIIKQTAFPKCWEEPILHYRFAPTEKNIGSFWLQENYTDVLEKRQEGKAEERGNTCSRTTSLPHVFPLYERRYYDFTTG